MKLYINRILPPEEVLGLRGDKHTIEAFNVMSGAIEFIGADINIRHNYHHEYELNLIAHVIGDPALMKMFEIAKRWKEHDDKKVFYFPKSFSDALSEIKMDIPGNYLPKEKFVSYFAFPQNYLYDGESKYSGCWIYCIPKHEIEKFGAEAVREYNQKPYSHRIVISMTEADDGSSRFLDFPIEESGNLEEILKSIPSQKPPQVLSKIGFSPLYEDRSGDVNEVLLKMVKTIINGLLYITSQEPNMDHLKPESQLGRSEKKQKRDLRNYCHIPVTLVNWNYSNGVSGKTEHSRRGHFRWQPHGPQLCWVKLIWIDETIVNRGKHVISE